MLIYPLASYAPEERMQLELSGSLVLPTYVISLTHSCSVSTFNRDGRTQKVFLFFSVLLWGPGAVLGEWLVSGEDTKGSESFLAAGGMLLAREGRWEFDFKVAGLCLLLGGQLKFPV
jgi:hypothetical protein